MFRKKLLFILLFTGQFIVSSAQISFGLNQTYNYLKGSGASNLSDNWTAIDFDDSSWSTAQSPFRYGDGTGGTNLTDMQGNYSTVYLRTAFNASEIKNISKITLNVDYDDGFIVWINGSEIVTVNAPDNPAYNATAIANHESGSLVPYEVDSSLFKLSEGENLVAVQIFNVSLSSSDFYFDMSMEAIPELPVFEYDTTVVFSHNAGIYSNPFNLTLQSPDSEYTLLYTIDGSDPQNSSSAKSAVSTTNITIDPDITTGRGLTPAFVVRASLVKSGYQPSFSITKTYLFTEKVANQGYPGYTWPSGDVNDQVLDYAMATDVTQDTKYAGQLSDAMLQIPSVSIVTDPDNLFDPGKGIYVNAEQKGEEWERPCSFEIINSDGSAAVQVNAGLRIRGGNSAKNKNNPKHAFRLFFRSEYGAAKLKYPLFEDEGADEFDAIDLRCEQNYSWSMDGSYHNTMVKDIFSRDLQGKMGEPYKRGRYYHLYLNGMYWGIFQTDERSEASYAETYLGGDKEDYDVIKVDTKPWPYYCEATDGNMDAWNELWDLCRTGFVQNSSYFNVQGLDATGSPDANLTTYVDVDNLIDYMLLIFYTGNFDAPVSAWYSDDMPNNFYALYNRKNKSQGFKFLAHDSEHSMFVEEVFGRDGINENRVNIGSTGSMRITNELDFNPQWLHFRLTQNSEYKQKFMDRAYALLSEGGILSTDSAKALFKKRVDQIDLAIIAESARWGDAQTRNSLTKDDDWLPEINTMLNEFFPQRTSILVQQLKSEGLYSSYMAPEVYRNNQILLGSYYTTTGSTTVSIRNPNTNGTIYYTLNNSDPRATGGTISEDAVTGTDNKQIEFSNTIVLTTRVQYNNIWGPVKKIIFSNTAEDYSSFKVTELHYHPEDIISGTDTTSGKKFEFIEFKNTGDHIINLSGLHFTSGIEYAFPENNLLEPGSFYVIASKPNYFFDRYGLYPSGNFSDQLNNGGELIEISDSEGLPVLSFTYDDKAPWPYEPDGSGYTLTSAESNPTGDPNDYTYWKVSSVINGTPFADDIETATDYVQDAIPALSVYPNPASSFAKVDLSDIPYDSKLNITIYTANGSVACKNTIINHSQINFNKEHLKPGVYFLQIEFNNYSYSNKLVIIP
ncbi:CotH kinase family protein [Saccharicrinis sp. FJH62]|uniref:CotH kinase family protein n=1 Tax=Saccharicrinis sp. FJH62 TaxID=3344657 RepID=UPI0035D51737